MNKDWNGTTRDGRHASESNRPLPDQNNAILGKVFGVDELATLFDCSTEKIKRRARSGELPAFKFGRSWFVRQHDLEAYIQRAVEAGSKPYRRQRE
jgi:excisionase family DNA binding protein